MAYANDVKFIRHNKLNPEDTNARINDCYDLWLAKEDDLLQVEKSWDSDYVDLVKPEEAIERYENYMKSNPTAREKYNKVRSGFISTYESLLYDRRTVMVAYLKSPWGINS
jgi:hypothetical protein